MARVLVKNDAIPAKIVKAKNQSPAVEVEIPKPAMPIEVYEPPAEEEPVRRRSLPSIPTYRPSRRHLCLLAETLLMVAVVVLAINAANLRADKNNLSRQLAAVQADPQALVQKQTDAIIAAVGLLMNLPANETPTVAAVSDATAAKQQSPFFNDAQNGDKVLMYVKAGEAILYRPSTNKIILVAPLTFNNTPAKK